MLLGAGASVDYGLPVWKDLASLIKEEINKDHGSLYQYKKEILAWIEKVGENKEYPTIDQCLQSESVSSEYHTNGLEIENQILLIIKNIFTKLYKENDGGWIRKLNTKILQRPGLVNKMVFVNYNYDDVLEKNLLNFDHLPQKHKIINHRERLDTLAHARIHALYPHGNLFSKAELPSPSHVARQMQTMKSGVGNYVDAVSCYESDSHNISTDSYIPEVNLYLLGLGGGLEINLTNLVFEVPVSKIYVTIRDVSIKDRVLKFLSDKFEIPVDELVVYGTCADLIDNCF